MLTGGYKRLRDLSVKTDRERSFSFAFVSFSVCNMELAVKWSFGDKLCSIFTPLTDHLLALSIHPVFYCCL
jgi:hypothetical protein